MTTFRYHVSQSSAQIVAQPNEITAVLQPSGWDDYGFGTTFAVSIWIDGTFVPAGMTKIGRKGMTSEGAYGSKTYFTELPPEFLELGDEYFSVGQDASLYSTLVDYLGLETAAGMLGGLRDLAALPDLIYEIMNERVAQKSLFRSVSVRMVRHQYARILEGGDTKEGFVLRYAMHPTQGEASPTMEFRVEPRSAIPSNVHVIIGANGTGKTTTLRNIRWALDGSDLEQWRPEYLDDFDSEQISGLVSVSFSSFDVFPEHERPDIEQATFRVTNVGLPWVVGEGNAANRRQGAGYPSAADAQLAHYREMIAGCLENREERLLAVFRFLADADLILDRHNIVDSEALRSLDFPGLSSGHKIVILTMASLVRYVEERTLVLIDEPESHLHPPLLAAFARALSWLMTDTNGLAIVATHSPVVLQEVPAKCAWKVWSVGAESDVDKPSIETFGENLGVLSREVFGIEMDKSGYHAVLRSAADAHTDYSAALASLGGEIGEEAKLILRSMIRRSGEDRQG